MIVPPHDKWLFLSFMLKLKENKNANGNVELSLLVDTCNISLYYKIDSIHVHF